MDESLRHKVDARGRYQLEQGLLRGGVEVLIRTDSPVTPQQQSELRQAGCIPRSVAGNVLSASIPDAAQLDAVAALPFVRKIELSRPMFDEPSAE